MIEEKNKNKIDLTSIKSVRVVCNDPYATESSSEDEAISSITTCRPTKPKHIKRHVSKICVPTLIERSTSNIEKVTGNRKSSSGFKGVRRRPWGRFAAEIRDPFQKKRMWLGTFDTVEAAAEAYQKSKSSFEQQLGQVNQTGLIKQEAVEEDLAKACGSSKQKELEANGKMVNNGTVVEKTFRFGCDDEEEEGTIDRMLEDPFMTSSMSDIFGDTIVKPNDYKSVKTESDIRFGFDDSKLGDDVLEDFPMDYFDSWFNGNLDWMDMGCL